MMNNTDLKPSFFIQRDLMQSLYRGDLPCTDFIVLLILFEKANPTNGIATTSYHGIGDMINKSANTIKSAICRLKESKRIIIDCPKQGQRSFRIGVFDFYQKNKKYTTEESLNLVFIGNHSNNCKVNNYVAMSNMYESERQNHHESAHEIGKTCLKQMREILAKSAKPLERE